MSHIIVSMSSSMPASRFHVLHRAAQHMPPDVRTMTAVLPGRLPMCHQFLSALTAQPLAYDAFTADAVVMVLTELELRMSGFPPKPSTRTAKRTTSVAVPIQPP